VVYVEATGEIHELLLLHPPYLLLREAVLHFLK